MDPGAIMVTGSSGFIGQQLVRRLADDGKTVVAVYRHKLPEALDRVYPVHADFSAPELMAAPLRGVDTVAHLAWEGGLTGPEAPFQFKRHVPASFTHNLKMLRHLITAMERAGTKRIILLSALGASGSSESAFLREKYAAESLVLNAKIPSRIILRSAVVWGGQKGNDRFLRSILRVMRYPIYPVPRIQGRLAPLYIGDLAKIVASACVHPLNEALSLLDVHGGEDYQIPDVFRIVSERYAKRSRFAVTGVLGNSLLPLLERERRLTTDTPKLQQLLGIGGVADDDTQVANPLSVIIPAQLATFKDKICD